MTKITKFKFFLTILSIFILVIIVSYHFTKVKNFEDLLSTNKKNISNLSKNLRIYEEIFDKKKYSEEILILDSGKKFSLKKFFLGQINTGLKNDTYRWSYIDIYKNYFVVTSASGQIYFSSLNDFEGNKINLKEIESNIQQLSPLNKIHKRLSIKDILITEDGHMYLSYVKLTNNNCHNIAIAKAKMRFDKISFSEFFSFDECVKISEGSPSSQNGGRIVEYKNNKLLFTIGDFSTYILAQNKNSKFGKIFAIDKNDSKKYEIFSSGHRNQQGLFYDKIDDRIFSTEHGPEGGDEFNEILKDKNYGWPSASYGTIKGVGLEKQKKYPNIITLYEDHEKHGFQEPIKFFTPSIGISQLIKNFSDKNKNNSYFLTSMKNKKLGHSIYIIDFNKQNKVINEEKLFIGDRIRDIIYNFDNSEYVLMLESSFSVGVLKEIN